LFCKQNEFGCFCLHGGSTAMQYPSRQILADLIIFFYTMPVNQLLSLEKHIF
jgi:hypothetical protein